MGLKSCLYECRVMHRRILPKAHKFEYRIFMFSLYLDEIESLAKSVRGFGRNGRAPYAFLDRDHLAPNDRPVREKLTAYLREQGIELGGSHRVELVTLPRVLGYIFNPVSFFFCYEAAGRPLCAVVEVGNTFGEMKLFLVRELSPRGEFHLRVAKDFYVSPFSSLDTEFDFKLRLPGERLDVRIDDYKNGALTLVSALTGERAELTTRQLWWFTLKYPLITAKVIFLIHWHALLLWLKRVPSIAKTADIDKQRGVLRPHRSLAKL